MSAWLGSLRSRLFESKIVGLAIGLVSTGEERCRVKMHLLKKCHGNENEEKMSKINTFAVCRFCRSLSVTNVSS